MQPAMCAETLESTEHRRPGQSALPRLVDDPLVKRLPLVLVVFPDKDSEELTVFKLVSTFTLLSG